MIIEMIYCKSDVLGSVFISSDLAVTGDDGATILAREAIEALDAQPSVIDQAGFLSHRLQHSFDFVTNDSPQDESYPEDVVH